MQNLGWIKCNSGDGVVTGHGKINGRSLCFRTRFHGLEVAGNAD